MQIKGWMIDAARLPEPLPYYRKVIDFCAQWGFNTILFRLADDQGSALRFISHPELATHPTAFTPAELVGLVRYATEKGIDVVPEIESFGHTGFITRSSDHAALQDNDPASNSPYTGVIPNHPDTLALIADLYAEVAEIFPSRYLHAGCDEVNWGGSAYSQAAIAVQGRSGVWKAYLNRLNDLAHRSGKELMIWADHVLGVDQDRQAILEGLSRDIILVDWNYWDNDLSSSRPEGEAAHLSVIETNVKLALAEGFRVIGAPAWGWCRWGVRAGESQLRNIDAYADTYRAITNPRCLGVIVTHWVPSRFIPGGTWDGTAYAAATLNLGSAEAREFAFDSLVRQHFGAEWNAGWAGIFQTLYRIIPPRQSCSPAGTTPCQPVVWSNKAELSALLSGGDANTFADLSFTRLRTQLVDCQARVLRNQADFSALTLSVEYLEHIHWRCQTVMSAYNNLEIRAESLKDIAKRDAQMVVALTKAWDAQRFVDDPAKSSLLVDLDMEDQPLLAMRRAASFSAWLAEEPQRLVDITS